jgi:hypothetical protein
MPSLIRLDDERTWPAEVVEYLGQNREFFLAWERRYDNPTVRVSGAQYDTAVCGLHNVLTRHLLHGYHCSRLTQTEIAQILVSGMQLPSQSVLHQRIDLLQREGLIEKAIADRLKSENQSADFNRAGVIWFCFYPPRLAGQHGIERFFRSWGGEALYNSHEDDPLTGPILRKIGTPCLIEAHVPIAWLPTVRNLEDVVARRFLVNRGLKTRESTSHDGRAERPIPLGNIKWIYQHPEPAFVALTASDTWSPPLT